MPAVYKQRHRIEPTADSNFDDHRGRHNLHHQSSAALGCLIAYMGNVVMYPSGEAICMHCEGASARLLSFS